MKCNEAKNLILDILEDNISSREKQEFFKHLEECTNCKAIYNEFKTAKEEIKSQFDFDDFEYFDNTADIMESIDQNLYKDKKKTIARKFKDYRKTIITMVALIVLAITSIAFIVKDNTFKSIKDNQNDKYAGFTNRWDVIYSQNGNIIFKNFYKIKAYSKEKGIYFSIDLKEKGLKPDLKEDIITSVSKDGKLIFVFTSNEGKGVIIDIAKNKVYNLDIKLPISDKQGSKNCEQNIVWSDNSKYLMTLNREVVGEVVKNSDNTKEFYVLDLKDLNNIKISILEHKPEHDEDMNFGSKPSITDEGTVVIGNYIYDKKDYKKRININENLKENNINAQYSAIAKGNNVYIAANYFSKAGNKVELYILDQLKLKQVDVINSDKMVVNFINSRYQRIDENKLYLQGMYLRELYGPSQGYLVSYDLKTKESKIISIPSGFEFVGNEVNNNSEAMLYYSQRWEEENPMVLIKNDYINITLNNIGKGKFLNNEEVVFIQSNPKDDYNKFKIVNFNIKDKKYKFLYNSMEDKNITFKKHDYEYEARDISEIYFRNIISVNQKVTQEEDIFRNSKAYNDEIKPFVSDSYFDRLVNNRMTIFFKTYSARHGGVGIYIRDLQSMTINYDKNRLAGEDEISVDYCIPVEIRADKDKVENKNVRGQIYLKLVNGKLVIDSNNDNLDEFMK